MPHVVAWDDAYRDAGLTVIGIHSPEYAFEKSPANVKAGAAALGIEYPVALDNNLSTWTNYRNRYWPAHYLIDAQGVVRNIQFGEGNYAATETMMRQLLREAHPDAALPTPTDLADTTPVSSSSSGTITPESYLGTTKEVNFGGTQKYSSLTDSFDFPKKLAKNSFALSGDWSLQTQYISPTSEAAQVRLNYTAREVRMVLAGSGTVTISHGGTSRTISVSGVPRSYQLLRTQSLGSGTVDVSVGAGVQAFSFTFG